MPFPSPGDLPNPGTGSLALQADSLPAEPPGKPSLLLTYLHVHRPYSPDVFQRHRGCFPKDVLWLVLYWRTACACVCMCECVCECVCGRYDGGVKRGHQFTTLNSRVGSEGPCCTLELTQGAGRCCLAPTVQGSVLALPCPGHVALACHSASGPTLSCEGQGMLPGELGTVFVKAAVKALSL